MKKYVIFSFVMVSSCTSNKEVIDYIRETSYYCGDIKRDKNLSTSIIEGEIEYGLHQSEKGGFQQYYHFYPKDKELVWVESELAANINLTENYFYRNGELIYIESMEKDDLETTKKVWLKESKIFYENKSRFMNADSLVKKGNEYLREYLSNK